MSKTDKEITCDIVCEYIKAWGTQSNCVPVKVNDLDGLINNVYKTIHSLEEK